MATGTGTTINNAPRELPMAMASAFTGALIIGANCPGSSGTVPYLSLCHGVLESAQ